MAHIELKEQQMFTIQKMIKSMSIGLLVFLSMSCSNQNKETVHELNSPNAQNKITFTLSNGIPSYAVSHNDITVLNDSNLGFVFKKNDSLNKFFDLITVEQSSFDETWEQVWGEKKSIRNNYNQLVVVLQEKSKSKRKLEIEFRAFDDGVAFRYSYPEQGIDSLVIMDELTTFNISDDGDAWWIGAYQDNRYEYLTNKSLLSTIDTVHTPLTLKSENGLFLSFHEANLKDFASMTLARTKGTELKADLVPWADGDRVKTNGSFKTPWRTIQIAEKPGDLITSYLVLNLNEPNKLTDTIWIKPSKYLGIWWGMHISKYTFWESPKHGASTKNA